MPSRNFKTLNSDEIRDRRVETCGLSIERREEFELLSDGSVLTRLAHIRTTPSATSCTSSSSTALTISAAITIALVVAVVPSTLLKAILAVGRLCRVGIWVGVNRAGNVVGVLVNVE